MVFLGVIPPDSSVITPNSGVIPARSGIFRYHSCSFRFISVLYRLIAAYPFRSVPVFSNVHAFTGFCEQNLVN